MKKPQSWLNVTRKETETSPENVMTPSYRHVQPFWDSYSPPIQNAVGGRVPVMDPALIPEAERRNQHKGPHPTPQAICTSGVPLLPSPSVAAQVNPGRVPSAEDSAVCGTRLSLAQPSCAAAAPGYS